MLKMLSIINFLFLVNYNSIEYMFLKKIEHSLYIEIVIFRNIN